MSDFGFDLDDNIDTARGSYTQRRARRSSRTTAYAIIWLAAAAAMVGVFFREIAHESELVKIRERAEEKQNVLIIAFQGLDKDEIAAVVGGRDTIASYCTRQTIKWMAIIFLSALVLTVVVTITMADRKQFKRAWG